MPIRTVVTDSSVNDFLERLYGSMELADHVLQGVYFVLARAPERGVRVVDDLYFIALDGGGLWKPLAIYYRFTDSEVCIVYAQEAH